MSTKQQGSSLDPLVILPGSIDVTAVAQQPPIQLAPLKQYYDIEVPNEAKLQKLSKEINWASSNQQTVFSASLKNKFSVMKSKGSTSLHIAEILKHGILSSNISGSALVNAHQWSFEGSYVNPKKNSISANYSQKDVYQSPIIYIKRFGFNFSMKNLSDIKVKPSIHFKQNFLDLHIDGTFQQGEAKQKGTAIQDLNAVIGHVSKIGENTYLEALLQKKHKKPVNFMMNGYIYQEKGSILNTHLSFTFPNWQVRFKEASLKFQSEKTVRICTGYNSIEKYIWYSTIQSMKNLDVGFIIQKNFGSQKIKKDQGENNQGFSSKRDTSIAVTCKFNKIPQIPNLSSNLHLENFHMLSCAFKYNLGQKNSIEAIFRLPLFSEPEQMNSKIEKSSDRGLNFLPFNINLKLQS